MHTKEPFHPCHQVVQTTFPLQEGAGQQRHSKEGTQHHYHEHDHPGVEINTCKRNMTKQTFRKSLLSEVDQLPLKHVYQSIQ